MIASGVLGIDENETGNSRAHASIDAGVRQHTRCAVHTLRYPWRTEEHNYVPTSNQTGYSHPINH